jgi:cell division transport system permease protein
MLWLSFVRVFRFSFQNFWRNFWLSVVTVTIMALSLTSVSVLGLLGALSNEAMTRLQERIDVSVFLKPGLAEKDLVEAQKLAEAIPGVKNVEVTSADKALAEFQAKHKDNPLIAQALTELGANPLGASLTVRAISEKEYPDILRALQGDAFKDIIQEAHFDDYRQVIQNLSQLSDRLTFAAECASGFFLLIALLVVFNTIRMNIYTHREEIGIMRLVGGSNWFIRAPFLVESILYAFLGTLLTMGIFFLLQPYVSGFFGDSRFNLVYYSQMGCGNSWPHHY